MARIVPCHLCKFELQSLCLERLDVVHVLTARCAPARGSRPSGSCSSGRWGRTKRRGNTWPTRRCGRQTKWARDRPYPAKLQSRCDQVPKCLDHTVWWDDGGIGDHVFLNDGGAEQMCLKVEVCRHDERGGVEVPEESRPGVYGHCVTEGRHAGPRGRRIVEGVL